MSRQAAELLEALRHELGDVERAIRVHPFLDALAQRTLPERALVALAGEQFSVIASDRRSFAMLAARFPTGLAGEFFLAMAEGEGRALALLDDFAAWTGLDGDGLRAYEPRPGGQAYPAFVAWLALNGSRADVALAFLANLEAWGANCGRVAQTLRERYDAPDGAVAFFEFFASPPPGFEARALAVLDDGLAAGESPVQARRAARLLQAYELQFWDALTGSP
jgi:thiaminase